MDRSIGGVGGHHTRAFLLAGGGCRALLDCVAGPLHPEVDTVVVDGGEGEGIEGVLVDFPVPE